MGALLTGFLAVPAKLADGVTPNPDAVNGNLASFVDKFIYGHSLWMEQVKAIGVTLVLAVVSTVVLGYLVKLVIGLRPSEESEHTGLDITDHGEEGYHDISNEGYGHTAAPAASMSEEVRPQMSPEAVGTINA